MTRNTDRPVAVVTGVARALGKAIALRLAREGFDLSLAARSTEALHDLRQELANEGAYSMVTSVDPSDCADRIALIEQTLEHMGRVDVLINSASPASLASFVDSDWDELSHEVDVNLDAPMHLSLLAVRAMTAQGGGAIVNISSLAPTMYVGGAQIGRAISAGLNEFTRMLRAETGSRGIAVSAVLPAQNQSPAVVAGDVIDTLADDGFSGASGRSRLVELVA
jgi:3-oxoacyl-[acyl-carrier protein] reductase